MASDSLSPRSFHPWVVGLVGHLLMPWERDMKISQLGSPSSGNTHLAGETRPVGVE